MRGGAAVPAQVTALKVVAETHGVDEAAIAEARVDAISAAEEELPFGTSHDECTLQYIVFQAGFQARESGVVHALTIFIAEAGAYKGPDPLAEMVIQKTTCGAIPAMAVVLVMSPAHPLPDTDLELIGQVPAEFTIGTETTIIQVLIARAAARNRELAVTCGGTELTVFLTLPVILTLAVSPALVVILTLAVIIILSADQARCGHGQCTDEYVTFHRNCLLGTTTNNVGVYRHPAG